MPKSFSATIVKSRIQQFTVYAGYVTAATAVLIFQLPFMVLLLLFCLLALGLLTVVLADRYTPSVQSIYWRDNSWSLQCKNQSIYVDLLSWREFAGIVFIVFSTKHGQTIKTLLFPDSASQAELKAIRRGLRYG